MAKEILIYGGIYDFTAAEFIEQMEEASEEDVTLRVNSDGGEPDSGLGMIAKIQEHKGKVLMKVDGKCYSTATFLSLCIADVEAVDSATFGFHRAALPPWIENDPKEFDEARKKILSSMNLKIRKLLTAKVDVALFEKYAKATIDEIFSMDGRVTVVLTAAEAEKCKLVSRVVKITSQKRKEMAAFMETASSQFSIDGIRMAAKIEEEPIEKKSTTMTLAELKAQHPAIYAEAVTEGIAKEKDRVEAYMVFAEVDLPGVKKGIEEGKGLSAKMMAEFTLKVMSHGKLKDVVADSAEATLTEQIVAKEKTAKEKNIDAFEVEMKAEFMKQQPSGGKKVA